MAKKRPTHDQYRAAAIRMFYRDGEIEIDRGAAISAGDDPGAYVAAWVWVPDKEAHAEKPAEATAKRRAKARS